MSERDDRQLEALLASEQGLAWRERLAATFFHGEDREHIFEEVRAALASEQTSSRDEVLAALCFEPSRRAVAPRGDAPVALLAGEELIDRVIDTSPPPVARAYRSLTEEEPGAGAF